MALAPSGARGVGFLYDSRQKITIPQSDSKSSDATLASLVISAGGTTTDLTPPPSRHSLTAEYTTTELTVAPTATYKPSGISVAVDSGAAYSFAAESGDETRAIPLAVGINTISVTVTAENGTSSEAYEVVVTRASLVDGATVTASSDEFSLTCPGTVAEGSTMECTLTSLSTSPADWPVVAFLHSSADVSRALIAEDPIIPESSLLYSQDIRLTDPQVPAVDNYNYGYGELFSGGSRSVYATYGFEKFDWLGARRGFRHRATSLSRSSPMTLTRATRSSTRPSPTAPTRACQISWTTRFQSWFGAPPLMQRCRRWRCRVSASAILMLASPLMPPVWATACRRPRSPRFASDDGASVVIADGDGETQGTSRSVSLVVGDNEITVTVTAEDAATTKTYTVTVARAEPAVAPLPPGVVWGDRLPDRDIALPGASSSSGVWSDGTDVWVVTDTAAGKISVYSLADGAEHTDRGFTLPGGAEYAAGLWSDGATLWVADVNSGSVRAYRLSDGARQADRDLDTAGNGEPAGIWSDGTTMWAADFTDSRVYAYDLTTKARVADKELDLDKNPGETYNPFGIWSNADTLLAASWFGGEIIAHSLADGQRQPAKDLSTYASRTNFPNGIWSNGHILWVVDASAATLYAYAVPRPRHTTQRHAGVVGDGGAREGR